MERPKSKIADTLAALEEAQNNGDIIDLQIIICKKESANVAEHTWLISRDDGIENMITLIKKELKSLLAYERKEFVREFTKDLSKEDLEAEIKERKYGTRKERRLPDEDDDDDE